MPMTPCKPDMREVTGSLPLRWTPKARFFAAAPTGELHGGPCGCWLLPLLSSLAASSAPPPPEAAARVPGDVGEDACGCQLGIRRSLCSCKAGLRSKLQCRCCPLQTPIEDPIPTAGGT